MNDEIKKIWTLLNLSQARAEALTTVVQAMIPLVQDDPRFIANLQTVSAAMVENRLNIPDVSDDFIAEYQEHLQALVPERLHPKLR